MRQPDDRAGGRGALGITVPEVRELEAGEGLAERANLGPHQQAVRLAADVHKSFLALRVVSGALELDQNGWLVAHDPSLVSGRYPVDISCRHIPGGPVIVLRVERSGQHVPD